MAKEAEQKTNTYLLGIVGIVAIVGLVILVLNAGGVATYQSDSTDMSGQAIRIRPGSITTIPNSIWRNIEAGTLDAAETQSCQCGSEICLDSNARCTNCEATYGTDCTPL